MKKIFLAAAVILTSVTVTFAQTTASLDVKETRKELRKERKMEDRNLVSTQTKKQFAIDFPDAKHVSFAKTPAFEEATFISGEKELMAFYDKSSNLVGTTQEKTIANLPGKAQKRIHEKYAGYTIEKVIKFDDNENNSTDMIMYETAFNDADNYFVELKNNTRTIVVKVDLSGVVTFFTNMK